MDTYIDHVLNDASRIAFRQNQAEDAPRVMDNLISAESVPENISAVDFTTFIRDYPEKLFPLLNTLRPEFQEYFIEYYLLQKDQYFLGKTHGCVQTRVWQALRIIEQTLGAMLVLGLEPAEEILRPILIDAGLEQTPCGSLAKMIYLYARHRSYKEVAKIINTQAPMVRKIFRPVVPILLAHECIRKIAVGAYLRNLTHQSSATQEGISKRALARLGRMGAQVFLAPPANTSTLVQFGSIKTLKNTPWYMIEIATAHNHLKEILPILFSTGTKIFGTKYPGEIFAPTSENGEELIFGYAFARCARPKLVLKLVRTSLVMRDNKIERQRGVSNVLGVHDKDGNFDHLVEIPNADVQTMIRRVAKSRPARISRGAYVEILTGDAARYCGTVEKVNQHTGTLQVRISFPSGRYFMIKGTTTSVKRLPNIPMPERTFWGLL